MREYLEEHRRPKNFKVVSKIMEADEIMNIIEDALHQHSFIIGVIVSNDKKLIQDVINNT